MNNLLEDKLLDELRFRQSRLFIPHCGTIVLALLVFWDYYTAHPLSCIPFLVLLLSLGCRYLILGFYFDSYREKRPFARMLFYAAVSATGLCWGFLFSDALKSSGAFSIHALFYLGMILTVLSGAATVFSASVSNAIIFCISSVAYPVFLLLLEPSKVSILGYLLLLNCGYQIYHATIVHNYLRGTILNELQAKFQTETLQEYIDAIPGIVGIVDTNATYTMINNFLDGKIKKAILGTKVGQTLKDNPISLLILEFLKSKDLHWVREVHANDLAGENWYLVNLKKIHSPYEGILVAALPINEVIHLKNDLKIQEARSQYAAKLASLGELSASIAHEINNPLTIIEGASNQIRVSIKEEPKNHEFVLHMAKKISETTQRISRIVKSLKSLSQNADEEPFATIQFRSIVEPAQEISNAKLREHEIELKIFDHSEGIDLFGNEIQLSQVLLNLISNSIDAIISRPERWIEIHYRAGFEWTDIIIIDSGKGIPESIREDIMKPFYTTKSGNKGTGLGLSISKNIIENHLGQLNLLVDEPNTTFQIRLPRMSPWKTTG